MNAPFQIIGNYVWDNPSGGEPDASFVDPMITITRVQLDDEMSTNIDILVVDENDSISYTISSTDQPVSRADEVVVLWVEAWLVTNMKI